MSIRLLPVLALLALAIAGCGRGGSVNAPSSASQSSTDEALIAGVVASAPEIVDDGQFDGQDPALLDAAPAGALAAIEALRFWRVVRSDVRSFEVAFADSDSTGRPTRATVTVHRHLLGDFDILAAAGVDTSLVTKPLDDRWVRRLALVRLPGTRRWHIVATSGVRVTARDAATRIVSLRLQGAGVDTTLTDPLAFFRLRGIIRLEPGALLTLTVTTLRDDDVVVLCRLGHRVRFAHDGDHTYTGTWQVPAWRPATGGRPPVLHLGVNALSHATLFDDHAPYDSQAWIVPAVLAPDTVAEQLP